MNGMSWLKKIRYYFQNLLGLQNPSLPSVKKDRKQRLKEARDGLREDLYQKIQERRQQKAVAEERQGEGTSYPRFITTLATTVLMFVMALVFVFVQQPIPDPSYAAIQIEVIRGVVFLSTACAIGVWYQPDVMTKYLDKLLPILTFLAGYFFPSGNL